MWQVQLLLPLSDKIQETGLNQAMDKQREENSIALPKALWDDVAIRVKTYSCGIDDIIQRALLLYFSLTGTPRAGESPKP